MGELRSKFNKLATAIAITLSTACSMPNNITIDSVINSAQEHISEFVESEEYTRYLFRENIKEIAQSVFDTASEQVNTYFSISNKVEDSIISFSKDLVLTPINRSFSLQDKMENFVSSSVEDIWDFIHKSPPRRIELWADRQINSLFGFNTTHSVPSNATVDFDSFADIDSTIVTDFAARYSNPLEMKPFLVDTLDFVSAGSMYGKSLYIPSTKVILSENAGVCLSASVSLIPAALEDDGYLPSILIMYNKERVLDEDSNISFTGPGVGHAVFLYHNDLIGKTLQHTFYNNEFVGELFFRDFMHNQPGWYTAGINARDFAGPYDSVDDVVENYSYCKSLALNLNDFDLDFKYSNNNIYNEFMQGSSSASYRGDLENGIQLKLTPRVTILIDDSFIQELQELAQICTQDTLQINYLSFLQNQD
ncbi:MAG: hypothetical protein KAQ83_02630 [Nanoarchaeota archaeon]|nr:hypothetical protein [Nanoarchaeota archaeon]